MNAGTHTLEAAARILALQECETHGHDWDIILRGAIPVTLVCGRCGQTHKVKAAGDPSSPPNATAATTTPSTGPHDG